MRQKRSFLKKAAVLLAAAVLCTGAAGMAAPMQALAAEDNDGQGELITVSTTQRCSIWSAPATTEENRIKYVDEGYQITIYPEVIESELGDGKTFYRTVKGSYVLCRCVVGAKGELIPVGDVPFVGEYVGEFGDLVAEFWFYDSDEEEWIGITNWTYETDSEGNPLHSAYSVDDYGVTYRSYGSSEQIQKTVAELAAEYPEFASFLKEKGDRIMICSGSLIEYDGWTDPEWGHACTFEFQRGTGFCVLLDSDMYEVCPEDVNEIAWWYLEWVMNNRQWQYIQ